MSVSVGRYMQEKLKKDVLVANVWELNGCFLLFSQRLLMYF